MTAEKVGHIGQIETVLHLKKYEMLRLFVATTKEYRKLGGILKHTDSS